MTIWGVHWRLGARCWRVCGDRCDITCMTRMLRPVSWASCSLMCLVGLGVAANAAFRVSSCLALIVVRGPLLFVPRFWSSFSLFPASLSETLALSESFASSWDWSWKSGDKLGSLPVTIPGREGTKWVISNKGWCHQNRTVCLYTQEGLCLLALCSNLSH